MNNIQFFFYTFTGVQRIYAISELNVSLCKWTLYYSFLISYILTVGYSRRACFGNHHGPFNFVHVVLHLFSITILTDGSRDVALVDER